MTASPAFDAPAASAVAASAVDAPEADDAPAFESDTSDASGAEALGTTPSRGRVSEGAAKATGDQNARAQAFKTVGCQRRGKDDRARMSEYEAAAPAGHAFSP